MTSAMKRRLSVVDVNGLQIGASRSLPPLSASAAEARLAIALARLERRRARRES
jgi:hypothetical protein